MPSERLRLDVGGPFATCRPGVQEFDDLGPLPRRQELGLSQDALARLVGTTQSSIARLERGGRPPRIDTLLRIADALECDLRVDLVPRAGPTKE